MRKPHFRAVDGAIARGLEDREDIVVFRVEDNALNRRLALPSVSLLCPFSSGVSHPLPSLRRTLIPTRADILGNLRASRRRARARGRNGGGSDCAGCGLPGEGIRFRYRFIGSEGGRSGLWRRILEAEVPILGCEAGERVWNDGAEDVSPMCSLSA